jgi:hypothetical protein
MSSPSAPTTGQLQLIRPDADDEAPWTHGPHGEAEWHRAGADLVIPSQPRTAVYLNTDRAVVIRQEGDNGDDSWVIIQPNNLPALVDRLREMEADQ